MSEGPASPQPINESQQSHSQALQLTQGHTRTYQACIPCRKRKVRCDLGPVDNPHLPPCVRCRRETKECYFSATRRKRKQDDDETPEPPLARASSVLVDEGDYDLWGGRKRLRQGELRRIEDGEFRRVPLRRGERGATLSDRPGSHKDRGSSFTEHDGPDRVTVAASLRDQAGVEPDGETAAEVLTNTEVYSGHHALAMLYQAAQSRAPVDPNTQHTNQTDETDEKAAHARTQSALEAWSRFRFVHQGWFTAQEGIEYVQYFFTHLAPLSAVSVPDFSDPGSHEDLLANEPMLTVTLLTVTSRYMTLNGPGARSRPHAIHEALWKCLREMIDRLLWGQEQFGNGFMPGGNAYGGIGSQPGCDVNPLLRTGLRTMGSIISLILLTEWHPRALHFPPGSDGDSLMYPSRDHLRDPVDKLNEVGRLTPGLGAQPMSSWLEPCWRSDRMCWMLLGLAQSVAYEIGVYTDSPDVDHALARDNMDSLEKVRDYVRRRRHVRETLRVYFGQTAGRLGLTSMLPPAMLSANVLNEESLSPDAVLKQLQQRLQTVRAENRLGSDPDIWQEDPDDDDISSLPPQELILHFWNSLADLMEHGNAIMFPNRQRTRELIKTQQYQRLLQEKFHPLLRQWNETFETYGKEIPSLMRTVMRIEYEYARVYLNSLSLQAVVERCTHNSPPRTFSAPVLNRDRKGPVPYADLMAWCGSDRRYIQEMTSACRETLRLALELYRSDTLRHAPQRTYFRIISVAIILLKTFVLGATEDDVQYSLSLLEQCTSAFRVSIVDDVHVSSRFADLCDALIGRIRARFVRLSAAKKRRSRTRSGTVHNAAAADVRAGLNDVDGEPKTGRTSPSSGTMGGPRGTKRPRSSSSHGVGVQFQETVEENRFHSDLPTLQPTLTAGQPMWRIPGTDGNSSTPTGTATADPFPAVNILPPPGMSLMYGDDEGLVLGAQTSPYPPTPTQPGQQQQQQQQQLNPSLPRPTQTNGNHTINGQRSEGARTVGRSNGAPSESDNGSYIGGGHTDDSFGLTSPAVIPVTPMMRARMHPGAGGALTNGGRDFPSASPDQLGASVGGQTMGSQQQQQQQQQQPTGAPSEMYEWPHWDQNWLVLPIDPILGSHGADVTQTTYGPDIGGMDMLDVLLHAD